MAQAPQICLGDIVEVAGEAQDLWVVRQMRPGPGEPCVWVERVSDGYCGGWEPERKCHRVSEERLTQLRAVLIEARATVARLEEILNSKRKVSQEAINHLDALQEQVGGVRCVQSIITYLRRGDIESAQAVRTNEGDKTRGYPEIETHLYKMFGCRIHGIYGCDGWLCKAQKPSET